MSAQQLKANIQKIYDMQRFYSAFIVFVALVSLLLPSRATAVDVPTPTEGSDYVILNVETGLFLRSEGSSNAASFKTFTEANASNFLWQFKKSGTGYLISNDAISEEYLTADNTSSTYLGKFDAKGTPWYFVTNPYNSEGYLITSESSATASDVSTLTHCFYAYYYREDKYYYLCSTDKDAVDLEEHSKKWYFLPTFRIFSYHELFAWAKKSGYDGTEATSPKATDWKALTDYVSTPTKLADDTKYNSLSADTKGAYHKYVIASRRYHKFLAVDTRGAYHSADKITTASVFNSYTGSTTEQRVFKNAYHGDGMTLTLTQAHRGHKGDFYLTDKDGKYLAVDKDGTVSTADFSTSNSGNLAALDREWVIAENPYDDNEQYINLNQKDIADVQNWYFRIENTGKRIKLRKGVTDKGHNQAGYLTDVDKQAFPIYDKANGTYISKADIFSNTVNVKDAANIWHITRAYTGEDENNQPIGIVGNFPHSLYYIQNANSGKYIGEPADGSQLMPLVAEVDKDTKAALFYFLPKDENNDTGVYSIMLLDKTKPSKETPKGYLDIADVDDNGVPNSDAAPSLSEAALVYRPCTTAPTEADAYAWAMHRARFIEARAVYSDNAKALGDYRYVTVWFPFDVVNYDSNVKLFYGKWNGDHTSVRFYPTTGLPARHGAMVLAPKSNEYEYVRLSIETANDCASDISNDVLTGVAEGEDYLLDDKSRKKIYVFSETDEDGNDMELRLGHPVDQSLMANRCYVKATTASESVVRSGKEFTFGFGDDMSTDIISPRTIGDKGGTPEYYNLEGIRVEHPAHGIYIHNGKKILVK